MPTPFFNLKVGEGSVTGEGSLVHSFCGEEFFLLKYYDRRFFYVPLHNNKGTWQGEQFCKKFD